MTITEINSQETYISIIRNQPPGTNPIINPQNPQWILTNLKVRELVNGRTIDEIKGYFLDAPTVCMGSWTTKEHVTRFEITFKNSSEHIFVDTKVQWVTESLRS